MNSDRCLCSFFVCCYFLRVLAIHIFSVAQSEGGTFMSFIWIVFLRMFSHHTCSRTREKECEQNHAKWFIIKNMFSIKMSMLFEIIIKIGLDGMGYMPIRLYGPRFSYLLLLVVYLEHTRLMIFLDGLFHCFCLHPWLVYFVSFCCHI